MRLAVLFLAACFTPSYTPGSPCDPLVGCPGGLVCDEHAPGGPTCVEPDDVTPPPVDTDDDGVLDEDDNCPTLANTDQRDEDRDELGNACDNCPHLANLDQANADADAVGDACDPGPEPHAILAFADFEDPIVPAGFTAVPAASWTFGEGVARAKTAAAEVASLVFVPPANARVRVMTRFTVEAINPPGGNATRNAGIAHQFDPVANVGTGCIAVLDQNAMTNTLWLLNLDGASTIQREDFVAFAANTTFDMATDDVLLPSGGAAVTCRAIANGMTTEVTGMGMSTSGGVGLRTRGTTTRYEYAIVIGAAP